MSATEESSSHALLHTDQAVKIPRSLHLRDCTAHYQCKGIGPMTNAKRIKDNRNKLNYSFEERNALAARNWAAAPITMSSMIYFAGLTSVIAAAHSPVKNTP